MVWSCIKDPAPYVPSCFFQACAVGKMHQSYPRFRLSLYVPILFVKFLLLSVWKVKRRKSFCLGNKICGGSNSQDYQPLKRF
jgi:hypothetical protein